MRQAIPIIHRRSPRKPADRAWCLAVLLTVVSATAIAQEADPFDQFVGDMKSNYKAVVDFFSGGSKEPQKSEQASAQATPDQPGQLTERSDIEKMQTLLLRLGYASGSADGLMGPQTREAIKGYQRDNNLAEDGQATIDLLERLQASVDAAPAPAPTKQPPPTHDDVKVQAKHTEQPPVTAGSPSTKQPATAPEAVPQPSPDTEVDAAAPASVLPAVDTLGVKLGMSTDEARQQREDLEFARKPTPMGIRVPREDGAPEAVAYAAETSEKGVHYLYLADPFEQRIYQITRLVDLGHSTPLATVRDTLQAKYGEAQESSSTRMCWGNCGADGRILKSFSGRSVAMELIPDGTDTVAVVRTLLWDGTIAEAARQKAEEQPGSDQPKSLEHVLETL